MTSFLKVGLEAVAKRVLGLSDEAAESALRIGGRDALEAGAGNALKSAGNEAAQTVAGQTGKSADELLAFSRPEAQEDLLTEAARREGASVDDIAAMNVVPSRGVRLGGQDIGRLEVSEITARLNTLRASSGSSARFDVDGVMSHLQERLRVSNIFDVEAPLRGSVKDIQAAIGKGDELINPQDFERFRSFYAEPRFQPIDPKAGSLFTNNFLTRTAGAVLDPAREPYRLAGSFAQYVSPVAPSAVGFATRATLVGGTLLAADVATDGLTTNVIENGVKAAYYTDLNPTAENTSLFEMLEVAPAYEGGDEDKINEMRERRPDSIVIAEYDRDRAAVIASQQEALRSQEVAERAAEIAARTANASRMPISAPDTAIAPTIATTLGVPVGQLTTESFASYVTPDKKSEFSARFQQIVANTAGADGVFSRDEAIGLTRQPGSAETPNLTALLNDFNIGIVGSEERRNVIDEALHLDEMGIGLSR